MKDKEESIRAELAEIRAAGRWRSVGETPAPGAISFSSNDYLDLARNPSVVAAAHDALDHRGTGACASRLLAGNDALHTTLEDALAAFFSTQAALVFPSGYQANIGIVTALANREATIFSDALNHASLIDGARLSRATIQVYPHNDVAALEAMLSCVPGAGRKLIITESVFSMDGDCAPVAALADLAARHDAWLIVDEAHAIGVFGQGRGLCAAHGVKPDVLLGTLSKALGGQGGFVACSNAVHDLLVNKARTFIFSTGLAPASAAAAHSALGILRDTPGMGMELLRKAALFRDALRGAEFDVAGESQIVPILLSEEIVAMAAAAACRTRGILAHGIRPPTVPAGQCRLRLSVTLAHSDASLLDAATKIAEAIREARS